MNSLIIFIAIIIVLVYTLYYTFNNDFGMFLFVVLLLLSGLYIFEFVEEKISIITQKIDNSIQKIELLKNNLMSALNLS